MENFNQKQIWDTRLCSKYGKKDLITIGRIDENWWIINSSICQPAWESSDGTILNFDLGGGKRMLFSRDNSSNEIGDVSLYDTNGNSYELIDVYK